jgi:phosphoglycolate phosphatase
MIETLILDLDGPILDGKHRHYTCYRRILSTHGYAPVAIEEYWQLKRGRVDRKTLLARSNASSLYDRFLEEWLDQIEQEDLLSLDRVQPGSREQLICWKSLGYRLVLATMRHDSRNLYRQLDRLNLSGLFQHVVVCDHQEGGVGKAKRVQQVDDTISKSTHVWIGDTEADIDAARFLQIKVIVLTCGLRTESFLRSLAPDALFSDLPSIDMGVHS